MFPIVLWVMMPSKTEAQVLYGSLVGNISDPSGAVVAGAQVRLTDTRTSQTDEVTTNETGLYTSPNVIAGTYDLTVTARGVSVSKEQGIPVNANTLQRRDVTLQLGALAETVSVEASAVTLQTDSAAVTSEITSKELTNIPMGQYRNSQSMELLVPGATPPRFQSARTDAP